MCGDQNRSLDGRVVDECLEERATFPVGDAVDRVSAWRRTRTARKSSGPDPVESGSVPKSEAEVQHHKVKNIVEIASSKTYLELQRERMTTGELAQRCVELCNEPIRMPNRAH